MDYRNIMLEYFRAEEAGEIEAVVDLCDENVVVRNAANPPQTGKEGAREYVTSFKNRTDERRFQVLAMAQNGNISFAWWEARLTFKAEIAFGPITTKRPFSVTLQGVCRFVFTPEDLIKELDVFHETTTAFKLAMEASN